jgi:hypothetical protein
MTVESATYINTLNATYPASGDAKSEGDDHIRLIKSVLKATFPNIDAAVTATDNLLNTTALALTGGTMAGDIAMGNNDLGGLKTASFHAEYNAGNAATASAIDWNNGLKQKMTLTASTTVTFTAPPGPTSGLVLKVIQAAAGSFTVTWPAAVEWPASSAPTMTSSGSRHDLYSFYYDGTTYYGSALHNYNLA